MQPAQDVGTAVYNPQREQGAEPPHLLKDDGVGVGGDGNDAVRVVGPDEDELLHPQSEEGHKDGQVRPLCRRVCVCARVCVCVLISSAACLGVQPAPSPEARRQQATTAFNI